MTASGNEKNVEMRVKNLSKLVYDSYYKLNNSGNVTEFKDIFKRDDAFIIEDNTLILNNTIDTLTLFTKTFALDVILVLKKINETDDTICYEKQYRVRLMNSVFDEYKDLENVTEEVALSWIEKNKSLFEATP